MKKLLYVFQILLKLVLVFSIAFIWLRFFLKSIWLTIGISVVITISFEILHRHFQKRSKNQQNLKLKEKEDADNMFFSLLTNNKYLTFYEELFKTRFNNVAIKKNFLVITKEDKKTAFYPYLKLEILKPNHIVEIIKNLKTTKTDKITIMCYEYDKDTIAFLKNFKEEIIILDRFESYSLYKEYEFYPEITNEYKKEAKLTFKDLLSYSFNRSRTKGYLISALFLFITSFFVKINVYYCIISSLLLLFALISYINPKYNRQNIKEII